MRILNKIEFIKLLPIILVSLFFISASKVFAATAPDLGAADSYAVFGKAGVTNDAGGTTHIWGNVGADDMVTITNLISGQVGGAIIAPAADVQTDATAAYLDLMSGTQGTPTPLDLAGTHTIMPGVYDIAASTLNGVLTLDGAGVYIFRSSSSETTVASGTMNLINGACASNVFWAIPASMTIGAGAHVEGTIITDTGLISLGSGATLVGRAISLTKQVTLLLNQITQPICATPTSTPTSTSTSTSSNSDTEIAYCPPITDTVVTPIIIESKRIDKDSIYIKWGPYSGVNTFNVLYGFEEGKLLYNVDVTGFYTTINDLRVNQPIWVRVAARNDCQIGDYGEAKLVGGPRLPNTGFAPNNNNISSLLTQIINWIF